MSIDYEQVLNDIYASRETQRGRPARWPFFRVLAPGGSYTVECARDDMTDMQTRLCVAKWWYEKKLQAKFITRRVPTGVRVERVE